MLVSLFVSAWRARVCVCLCVHTRTHTPQFGHVNRTAGKTGSAPVWVSSLESPCLHAALRPCVLLTYLVLLTNPWRLCGWSGRSSPPDSSALKYQMAKAGPCGVTKKKKKSLNCQKDLRRSPQPTRQLSVFLRLLSAAACDQPRTDGVQWNWCCSSLGVC